MRAESFQSTECSDAKVAVAGETVHFVDHSLPMDRRGFLEEAFHTFSYSPFRGVDGTVLGILNTSFECVPGLLNRSKIRLLLQFNRTTAQVIAERRHGTVRDLVSQTAWSRSVPGQLCALRRRTRPC